MRRYALVLGHREQIRAEILHRIAGNEHFGKNDDDARAAVGAKLRAAFEAIDGGEDETDTGDFVYRVTYDSHPAPFTTTEYRQGTRAELVAELEQLRDGVTPGRDDKAAQYDEAIAELSGPLRAACTSALGTVYLVAQSGD